jgi:hypothetical protein
VHIPVYLARSENKAATKLKRILPQFMLVVASRPRPRAGSGVLAPQHVQKVRVAQSGSVIGLAFLVDQQRKRNACVLPELACIDCISESDGRQIRAALAERLFVCAQLRDVLTAEDSAIVAKEDHYGRLPLPKRSQTDLSRVAIGKNDGRQHCGERAGHIGKYTMCARVLLGAHEVGVVVGAAAALIVRHQRIRA